MNVAKYLVALFLLFVSLSAAETPIIWFIGDHSYLDSGHITNWTDEFGLAFAPTQYALPGGTANGHRLVLINGQASACFRGTSPAVGANYTVSLVTTLPYSANSYGYVFSGNRAGASPAVVNNYGNATFGVYTNDFAGGQDYPLTTDRTSVENIVVIVFSVTYGVDIVVSYNGVVQTIPEVSHTVQWNLLRIGCSNLGDVANISVGELRIYNRSFSSDEGIEESRSLAFKYITDLCSLPYVNTCSPHATCTNVPGNISCSCNYGYVGDGYTCTAPQVWYVGDDATFSGGSVQSWEDRIGGVPTAHPTAPSQGLSLNGHQTIKWNGSSCLEISNTVPSFGSEWTLAMVTTKSVAFESYYFGGNSAGASPAVVAGYVGDFSFYYCDVFTCSERLITASTIGGFHILVVSYEALGQVQSFFDGAYATTSSLHAVNSWSLRFLGCSDVSNYGDFSLAEFAVFPVSLSQSEMNSLSVLLAAKYNL